MLFRGEHPDLGTTTIQPSSASDVGLTINLQAGQTGDSVDIKNSAGTVVAKVDSSGNLTAASAAGIASLTSSTANPAQSGIVRLATTDTIAWRNAANSGDVTLSDAGAAAAGTGNIADLLKHAAGFQGAVYVDTSAAPAQSGVLATGNATTAVAARNQAGSGDIALLASNTSNRAVLAPATLTASTATLSSLNIPSGTAPTTPNTGDVWYDSTQLNFALTPTGVKMFESLTMNVNTTAVTVNANVTTAQNLMSFSVPAGSVNVAGKTLCIYGAGRYTTQAAQTPTVTIAVTIGGVTVGTWTSGATTAAATNMPWNFTLYAPVTTSGASGTFFAHGNLSLTLGTTPGAATATYNDTNTGNSAAVNLTTAETLQVTVTFSTNAATANTCTQDQLVIEYLN